MYGLNARCMRLILEIGNLLNETNLKIKDIEIRKGKLSFPCNVTEIKDGFLPYNNGDIWSGEKFDDYALFKFTVDIPDFKEGYDFYLDAFTNKNGGHNMVRPQMLLLKGDTVIQGLDTNHSSVKITEFAGEKDVTFFVYAYSGLPKKTPYGSQINMDTTEGVRLFLSISERQKELCDFYYNIKIPYNYLKYFEENSYEYQKILNSINTSLTLVDLRNPHSEEFYDGIRKANNFIKEALYSGDNSGFGKATLIGHTHIDLAWLWRYEHTMDKAIRSFATEVKLLGEYDEHRFMSSQAQLYEYVKNQTPELYEEIKRLVKEGKWEAEGAMWVEPDMNLASGESIILQILYGKKFFKDEFGVDCEILWLPDVFGYTAALPQILKKSGVKYFMTSKLVSNEKNRFPFDTFKWRGIDGSEIFSHCTTYLWGGYNPNIENGEVLTGWRRYEQKNINDDILLPFGFADGGGGVTAEQIEAIRRMNKGIYGVPKAKISTAGDYFKTLEKKVSENPKLPVWSGEIYYEKHRGTYTSMARNKKYNRKCEFLLSNVNWLWALANSFEKTAFDKKKFDIAMKNMLLNQFHDVLPGTSIKEVYEDSDKLYKEAFEIGNSMCEEFFKVFKTDESSDKITVFNPYSKKISGYVEHKSEYIYVNDVPAKGYGTYMINSSKCENPVKVNGNIIENKYYIIEISDNGEITRLYDKNADKECVISGKTANRLRVFEDKSDITAWGTISDNEDNWNLESYYTEREFPIPSPNNISLIKNNGEYAVIRVERKYMSSLISQDMIVYANSPRIDFKTKIDWKEHSQVLKAEFPINVNANRATYEIQFGYLERSTNFNTSWDEAKFEVCGHKWADISETDYGVAILNDCKYGYCANGSTISLTLLRSGNSPNPDADKEMHSFTYSIYPHSGDIKKADVVKEAYLLNNPLVVRNGGISEKLLPEKFSLFECEGAVLETIKPAENNDGVILRFYEPYNSSQNVKLKCGKNIKKAVCTDLMENITDDVYPELTDKSLSFKIKPFEIITLKLWLED